MYFKKLNSYIKFYFFKHWTSRKFKVGHAESFDDFLSIHKLRYEVYCEEYNYLDPGNYPDNLERDEFDDFSEHFILKHKNEGIVGYVRLIKNSHFGFPIENAFELTLGDININKGKTAEVSRLIVSSEFRRLHLLMVLIKEILIYAIEHDIEYVYSVMDDKLLYMLIKLGFTYKKIGPYKTHQGVTCPNILLISELEKNLKKENRFLYNYFFKN